VFEKNGGEGMSKVIGLTTLIALVFAPVLWADRTALSPGWTMFSHQQDVEIGRQLANDLEGQYRVFADHNSNVYLDSLGNQLAAHSPGERFSYQFKIVDDPSFNAFALPGGLIYVNRGVIGAAQNQGQLAAVLAHQIAHVALRHGSSQISNAYSGAGRRGVRGASVATVLSDLNIGFGPNAIPLKFTREEERQADIAAVQILHDSGFDPRAMTQIFEQQQNGSRRAAEFFTNHPAPLNFAAMVRNELQNVGGVPANLRTDNADFNAVKSLVMSTPESPRGFRSADRYPDRTTFGAPSTRMQTYNGSDIFFRHPSNWRVSEDAVNVTVAPSGAMVNGSLALGMQIGTYDWRGGRYFGEQFVPFGDRPYASGALRQATDQFLDHLRRTNPDMSNVRSSGQMRVDGEPALITLTTNESPLGGRETNWIVTTVRPGGFLWYFIGVAPDRDFNRFSAAFEDIVTSARID
jgi:hypothetical protein